MIVVRKAAERRYQKDPGQDCWHSFGPLGEPPLGNFGSLEVFRERRFTPRAAAREPRQEAEIITYVREGSLAYEDSLGQTGVLRRGEFQRMTTGLGLRYREMNVSPIHYAHVFQIWLRPNQLGLAPGHEQRRFSVAERKGRLCMIASPGGIQGSLKIHQDAVLYSGLFEAGQRVVYALDQGRGTWLHVISGEVKMSTITLGAGDGAGISEEAAVEFLVQEETEVLLLDLGGFPASHTNVEMSRKVPSVARRGGNGSSLLLLGDVG
jgi:quercetin 2,3-dioxygenase